MKSNITVIALNNNLKKDIAKKLADKLEMFYIDINELIKYKYPNLNEVISNVGFEYYIEEETKTVKTVSTYENALITVDLDTFFNKDNYIYLKEKSIFIYLKVDFENYKNILDNEIPQVSKAEKSLSKKVFKERDKILTIESDIIINIEDKIDFIDKIMNEIKIFYEVI